MTSPAKRARYYYWLIQSFFKKNSRFFVISIVVGFFFIFFVINFFPFLMGFLFRKNEIIGRVGQYTIDSPPSEVATLISNGLVTIDSKGKIIPLLTNLWGLSPDKKTYRFHLKSDLFWNNKESFDAYDLNYDFKGISIKPKDTTTVDFVLSEPLSIFPVYLTKPIIKRPLIGVAGLYRVQGFALDKNKLKEVRLIPNRKDLPYKTFRFYQNEDELITAYKKGEITIFKTNKKNIADSFQKWKNTKISQIVDYSQIITLFFNTQSPFLSSREVRRAIVNATPQSLEFGKLASGPIPPTSWAFAPNLRRYTYNLDRAHEVLGKSKTASGSAEISFYTFYDYIGIAEQVKKSYEKAGLKTNLKVLSYLPQDFDLLLTAWNPPQDPDQYYFWHSTQTEGNITNYKNVKVDKYLEEGRQKIQIDERKKIYQDFQKAIVDDLPAYFLYYPYVYVVERR